MIARNDMRDLMGMESMLKQLTDNWWLLLLQGVVSIVFGVLALFWPSAVLATLTVLFGWFALINGVITVVSALGAAVSHQQWGWRFAAGILGVVVGLVVLRWPGETVLTVLLFIGIWVIMTGLTQIIGAIAYRDEVRSAGWLVLEGIVAVLFGVAMLVWPGPGLLTLTLLVGIYAIVHGVVYCVMAFQVRSLGQQLTAPETGSGLAPT
jgi:uncharacterized membrane protein HdeD (DUF308 family)